MQGPPHMLRWMRDYLAGMIDAERLTDGYDEEQAKRALLAVTYGFDSVERVLEEIEREQIRAQTH